MNRKDIKVNMISLGCPKNLVDAEMMLASLRDAGYQITPNEIEAEVVIVNTCGFIESAKDEAIETILEVSILKNDNMKALIVTGCLAERYRDQVLEQLPEVDCVVGIGSECDIVSIVDKAMSGKRFSELAPKDCHVISGPRMLSTPFYTAYLRISDGCSNNCTYCAIPQIRGAFHSRPIDDVMLEAEGLVASGVKELVIIAQDTTRYGEDICGKSLLPELLTKLDALEGIEWIKVLYAYPERVTDELLDVMARCHHVAKYIDIPIQHANGKILKAMNRRGDREGLTALINKMREKVPGITLRTTLIAGFPGETEEQFTELHDFVKEIRFDRLGVFAYSPEEDTAAALLPGQIDEEIKLRRTEQIMETQSRIAEELNTAKIGTTVTAVVEGYDDFLKCYHGRTESDAPDIDGRIFFKSDEKHVMGDFVKIIVTDTLEYDIIGSKL